MVSMWDHWGKTQSKCVWGVFGGAESDWVMLGLEYQIEPNECVRWTIEFEPKVQRKCRSEWRRGQARPWHTVFVRIPPREPKVFREGKRTKQELGCLRYKTKKDSQKDKQNTG